MMIRCACLASAGDIPADTDVDLFVLDGADVGAWLGTASAIVLPTGDESRAIALLSAGARQVLLGEAVLSDADLVPRLAARFGTARVGVFVPARRMEVRWSFDTVCNADFRVVTPSLCEPGWEILRTDGSATGIRVDGWLGELRKRGAARVLVQVDIGDDTDLNLCAGLVGKLGESLWIAPRQQHDPMLADWVAYGKATQFALPPGLFARRADLLPAPPYAEADADADAVSPLAGRA